MVQKYTSLITFERIFSLCSFDRAISRAIVSSMIDFENHLCAVVAQVISDSFGNNMDDYLDFRNYQNRNSKNPRYSLSSILGTIRSVANENNHDPIKHYRDTYGNVPPEVLFKSLMFGTLVNYVRYFKPAQKKELIKILFGIDEQYADLEIVKNLLTDSLFVFLDYRNRAAHGGRIYNYSTQCKIRLDNSSIKQLETIFSHDIPNLDDIKIKHLIYLLDLYTYKPPMQNLYNELNKQLTMHNNKFPSDVQLLEQIIDMPVEVHLLAYISSNSKLFHANPNCSNGKYELAPLAKLLENGYAPCKKCCKKLLESLVSMPNE